MPYYLAIGLDRETVDDSCPKDLEPYIRAEKIKRKMRDEELWRQGAYNKRAFEVVIGGIFAKKSQKNNLKYFDMPILEQIEIENHAPTEDEIHKAREQFVSKLNVMGRNFNLAKKSEEISNGN